MYSNKRRKTSTNSQNKIAKGPTWSNGALSIKNGSGQDRDVPNSLTSDTLPRRDQNATCTKPLRQDLVPIDQSTSSATKVPRIIETSHESESSSDDEDEYGDLTTGPLEDEYTATLRAVRQKHPKLYDQNAIFYTPSSVATVGVDRAQDPKPILLKQYHRNILLDENQSSETEKNPSIYMQEQIRIKEELLEQIHAAKEEKAANGMEGGLSDDGEEMFEPRKSSNEGQSKSVVSADDVKQADEDPEAFLSRFLETRAWIPHERTSTHKFESDDENDDRVADEFEQAYNLRFEDSNGANEKITTHSRDAVARLTVRFKPETRRNRLREVEKAYREEARIERSKETAALKRLRMDEAETKLRKINETAGTGGHMANAKGWAEFLTKDWDGKGWDLMMRNRFGEEYHNQNHDTAQSNSDVRETVWPKWDSDIDISDIVPNVEDVKEQFSASGAEDERSAQSSDARDSTELYTSEQRDIEREGKNYRKSRRHLEQFVDEQVGLEVALDVASKRGTGGFRYRESSPLSFGLTAHDILMASDTQLNQFVGLRKIAAFRDADKLKKDKKRLGKRGRLRLWRKETFGDEQGPKKSSQPLLNENPGSLPNYLKGTIEAGATKASRKAMPKGSNRKKYRRSSTG